MNYPPLWLLIASFAKSDVTIHLKLVKRTPFILDFHVIADKVFKNDQVFDPTLLGNSNLSRHEPHRALGIRILQWIACVGKDIPEGLNLFEKVFRYFLHIYRRI